MTNEARLHDALTAVMNAYHLVLDGQPEEGAAYRYAGETHVFESDVPIMTRENYQVYIYQREYSPELIAKAKTGLMDAGFTVQQGGQAMEGDYYRDELRASREREEEHGDG